MDGGSHVCPDCGQSVDAVVRRHKTLGVWVPVWGRGPCRNPECEAATRTSRRQEGEPPARDTGIERLNPPQ
nr:hypothetical protein [Streptomyces durhamensis]